MSISQSNPKMRFSPLIYLGRKKRKLLKLISTAESRVGRTTTPPNEKNMLGLNSILMRVSCSAQPSPVPFNGHGGTQKLMNMENGTTDFSPLFNWNTKQLFVYVLASYPAASPASEDPRDSEAIVWDMIIPAPESPYSFSSLKERFFPSSSKTKPTKKGSKKGSNNNNSNNKQKQTKQATTTKPGVLHLKNQKSKYQITDISGQIAERENVTLSVGWNVQPWVGVLQWSEGTGAWPRTEGQVGRSKTFNFPPLKTKTESAGTQATKK